MTPDEYQQVTLGVRIAGVVLSCLGLFAVAVSIYQVRRTIVGNTFASVFVEIREFHKVLIDHPDLRPAFFEQKTPELDQSQPSQARELADMFLDAFIHMHVLRPRLRQPDGEALDRYIVHLCRSSPLLRAHLRDNLNLVHPDSLKKLVAPFTVSQGS